MSISKSGWAASLVGALVLLLAPAAEAALIQGYWSATIVSVESLDGDPNADLQMVTDLGAVVGATVTGSYLLDTDTPDIVPNDPGTGRYTNAAIELTIEIGGMVIEIPSPVYAANQVVIIDRPTRDSWKLTGTGTPSHPGFLSSVWELAFEDESRTALQSDRLDQIIPGLDAWNPFFGSPGLPSSFNAAIDFDGGAAAIDAEITSHSQAFVPVPAAVWMLLGGVGALASLRRSHYTARVAG